jgi:catalase
MAASKTNIDIPIVKDALRAFDDLNGPQPGFRPAHAKGILLSGIFTPSAAARTLTKAPHIQRASTPVTVRFSVGSGIPSIADNDPNASPRGCAIRFHLAEHSHTDIVAHSVNAFPARTAEEVVEFLRAVHATGPGASHPTPIESFLGTHPAALEFVQAPKPYPVSFAVETFYAISAYRFTSAGGKAQYGRYRIHPAATGEYLDDTAAARQAPNFLFDEIRQRLANGPATMKISLQLAADGDTVDDSTVHWPSDRPVVEFGVVELEAVAPDHDAEQRHIIFDPIPRVDGIDPSADPLLEARAAVYLASGRRRRAEGTGYPPAELLGEPRESCVADSQYAKQEA